MYIDDFDPRIGSCLDLIQQENNLKATLYGSDDDGWRS